MAVSGVEPSGENVGESASETSPLNRATVPSESDDWLREREGGIGAVRKGATAGRQHGNRGTGRVATMRRLTGVRDALHGDRRVVLRAFGGRAGKQRGPETGATAASRRADVRGDGRGREARRGRGRRGQLREGQDRDHLDALRVDDESRHGDHVLHLAQAGGELEPTPQRKTRAVAVVAAGDRRQALVGGEHGHRSDRDVGHSGVGTDTGSAPGGVRVVHEPGSELLLHQVPRIAPRARLVHRVGQRSELTIDCENRQRAAKGWAHRGCAERREVEEAALTGIDIPGSQHQWRNRNARRVRSGQLPEGQHERQTGDSEGVISQYQLDLRLAPLDIEKEQTGEGRVSGDHDLQIARQRQQKFFEEAETADGVHQTTTDGDQADRGPVEVGRHGASQVRVGGISEDSWDRPRRLSGQQNFQHTEHQRLKPGTQGDESFVVDDLGLRAAAAERQHDDRGPGRAAEMVRPT